MELADKTGGYVDIGSGLYVACSDAMTALAKTIDFSRRAYWITDDAGVDPVGFDTPEEGSKIIGVRGW